MAKICFLYLILGVYISHPNSLFQGHDSLGFIFFSLWYDVGSSLVS